VGDAFILYYAWTRCTKYAGEMSFFEQINREVKLPKSMLMKLQPVSKPYFLNLMNR